MSKDEPSNVFEEALAPNESDSPLLKEKKEMVSKLEAQAEELQEKIRALKRDILRDAGFFVD